MHFRKRPFKAYLVDGRLSDVLALIEVLGLDEQSPRREAGGRRVLQIELPEFLICALEARLTEVNVGAKSSELCSLHNLIESELVSLVSVRDVAEPESAVPGFAMAVQQWLSELRD